MCTLIVSVRQHPHAPLIVAANRDEVLDRPASGPRRWPGEPFVAPRDEKAGGAWLGLNVHGLFVGVTNRFPAERREDRESRGTLVVEALRAPSASVLHASLAGVSPTRFNPFHLLYADARDAFVTWSDGQVVRQDVLAPGLHVVTERSLGGDDHSRQSLIREAWPSVALHGGEPSPEALFSLLARGKAGDPLGGVCVEAPEWNYGTRSSMVLFRREPLSRSQLYWADGRPDRTPFTARPELVSALA
ncbi:MAG: NRDE family protein [Myxococcota bacterium]